MINRSILILLFVSFVAIGSTYTCKYSTTNYPVPDDSVAIINSDLLDYPIFAIKFDSVGSLFYLLDDFTASRQYVEWDTCPYEKSVSSTRISMKYACKLEEGDYDRTDGWLLLDLRKMKGFYRYKLQDFSGEVIPHKYTLRDCKHTPDIEIF